LITKFDFKNNLDIPIYLTKPESNTVSSVGNSVKIINCTRNGKRRWGTSPSTTQYSPLPNEGREESSSAMKN